MPDSASQSFPSSHASSSSPNEPDRPSRPQVPAVRSFQFDASGIGSLRNSVNLFRGDVTHTQKLVELPGRPGRDALSVNVSIAYKSDVARQAKTWNRDAATGVVGLGWGLPRERIVRRDDPSITGPAQRYAYVTKGSREKLVRDPEPPRRFSMPADLASHLSGAVGEKVQAAFTQRGLRLSAEATATSTGDGRWRLTDDATEQVFRVRKADGALQVHDGGETYQLKSYRFQRILYYPTYERWVVVKENGVEHSFGGGVSDGGSSPTSAGKTSAGNSVEWGVQWADADGTPLWRGTSGKQSGGKPSGGDRQQSQYAQAWNLHESRDPWGDTVTYRYNESGSGSPRSAAETPVGGGLPYTRECHLTSVTDVFGRTVHFHYGDKAYHDPTSAPGQPREYQPEHQRNGASEPVSAYQDRYETKYLDRLDVRGPEDDRMFQVRFDYDLRTVSGYDAGTRRHGDTAKRFLTGITRESAGGDAMPGFTFSYAGADSPNPGALTSMTYPEGGTATYTYEAADLPSCHRRRAVDPPEAVQDPHTSPEPRVWFGENYAVTVWANDDYTGSGGETRRRIALRVDTWLGRWKRWQPGDAADWKAGGHDPTLVVDTTQNVDLSTLEVVTGKSFFALHLQQHDDTESAAYVFQQDPRRAGEWLPYRSAGGSTQTGCNQPSIHHHVGSRTMTYEAGRSFLVATERGDEPKDTTIRRHTFDWQSRAWTGQTVSPPGDEGDRVFVAPGEETLALLAYDAGSQALHCDLHVYDDTLTWKKRASTTVQDFDIRYPHSVQTRSGRTVPGTVVETGASCIAVSCLRGKNLGSHVYFKVAILQWDANYQFTHAKDAKTAFRTKLQVTSRGRTFASLPYVPQVINNALVACGGSLIRFDGTEWTVDQSLANNRPSATDAQTRYAYTGEAVVQVQAAPSSTEATLLPYDAEGATWADTQSFSPAPSLTKQAAWPSAGGPNYVTVGPHVYARGTDPLWRTPPGDADAGTGAPIHAISDLENAAIVINQGPRFLGHLVDPGGGASRSTGALLFRNGAVRATETLSAGGTNEAYYTPREGGGPGRYPQGPASFVTYPSSAGTFDQADRIFLHRYAGDSLTEPITDRRVASLKIDDGFGASSAFAYTYDADHAAVDPTGRVVKHYRATKYPGCTDPSNESNGFTRHRYVNGIAPKDDSGSGDGVNDALDGYLRSKKSYAHGADPSTDDPVHAIEKEWTVFTQRSRTPDGTDVAPLYGGFVRPVKETETRDGVTTTRSYRYVPEGGTAPYSGQKLAESTTYADAEGRPRTKTVEHRHATDTGTGIAEHFRAAHRLTPVAQVVERKTADPATSDDAVVTTARATAFTGWTVPGSPSKRTVPARKATFHFRADASFSGFPFHSHTPGSTPEGWLRSTTVRRRTDRGLVTESAATDGTVQTAVYDADEAFTVAGFYNASRAHDECRYQGFESYERTGNWTIPSGTVSTGDAYLGTRSAALSGGKALKTTISPGSGAGRYVLGFWYKTPKGFSPGSGTAGWTVEGASGGTTSFSFADTGGEWTYASVGFEPGAGTVTLTASNDASTPVRLDAVHVHPLTGRFVAHAYDTRHMHVEASVGMGGRIARFRHDAHERERIHVGAGDEVNLLKEHFLSRQGNGPEGGGSFDPASPNAHLHLHPRRGGRVERFRNGGTWRQRWTPTDASTWSRSGGALHAAPASSSLTYGGQKAVAESAAYVEVRPSSSPGSPLGMAVDGATIEWSPSDGAWSFTRNGSTVAKPLAQPSTMGRRWLLVCGDGQTLFFADGQLIFSAPTSLDGSAISVQTGGNELALSNLSYLAEPSVTHTYLDAAGRARQQHELIGDDALVHQNVYDALGRQDVATRKLPASVGSSNAVLQYWDGLIDVASLREQLQGSGKLEKGALAGYYAGQKEHGVRRPDDQGYSYHRKRYDDTPLTRVVEEGRPGAPQAINLNEKPAKRTTVRFDYGSETLAAPSPSYRQETRISPVKRTRSRRVRNQAGEMVQRSLTANPSASSPDAGSNSVPEHRTTKARTYSTSGRTVTVDLPNKTSDGPQSDPDQFVATRRHDRLGRMIARTDADTGTTGYVYDDAGRVRIKHRRQDTAGSASGSASGSGEHVAYFKHDALGRVIEKGTVALDWSQKSRRELRTLANDPSWPSDSDSPTVLQTFSYDGDGNTPTLIGHAHTVTTTNRRSTGSTSETIRTEETFRYNDDGTLAETTVSVHESGDTRSHTVRFAYENGGQIRRIRYPGTALDDVVYERDTLGRIARIHHPDGTELASFTHDAEGNVVVEKLSGGTLTNRYTYTGPGWLTKLESVGPNGFSATQTFDRTPDGRISTYGASFEGANTPEDFRLSFTYDALERLAGASDAKGNLGATFDQYDPNGNLYEMTQKEAASGTLSWDYEAGSDRATALHRGGAGHAIETDPQGRVTQAPRDSGGTNHFAYDDGHDTPSTAQVDTHGGTADVTYAYGHDGQRVMKRVHDASGSTTTTDYVYGTHDRPLLRVTGGTPTAYVYGPSGVVAMQRGGSSGSRYVPVKDHQGTTRAVLSASGDVVAGYDYLPFGKPAGEHGPDAGTFAYRYTGQEYDAETEVYNYKARFYDAVERRFLSPDPDRQYPSPYVYVGDDPVMEIDPSGDLSIWADIGIGLAITAITIAGTAAAAFTGGASEGAAVSADAALAGAGAAAEAGTEAAAEAGTEAAAEAGAEAAAESGAEAATEASSEAGTEATASTVSDGAAEAGESSAGSAAEGSTSSGAEVTDAGATTGDSASTTADGASSEGSAAADESSATGSESTGNRILRGAKSLGKDVAKGAAKGAAKSAGKSAVKYSLTHQKNFSLAGLVETVGMSAAAGAVSGGVSNAVGGLLSTAGSGIGKGLTSLSRRLGTRAAQAATSAASQRAGAFANTMVSETVGGAAGSAASGGASTLMNNGLHGRSWNHGLGSSIQSGLVSGAATGAMDGAIKGSYAVGNAHRQAVAARTGRRSTSDSQPHFLELLGGWAVVNEGLWGLQAANHNFQG